MKNALIIHGMPSKDEYFDPKYPTPSNSHWIPWVEKQLLVNNIEAQAIEMPNAWNPKYEEWKERFEQFKLNQDTILIGHSLGGGFIVRYLSENNIKVGSVFLVAPWLDVDGLEKGLIGDFFDFRIDPSLPDKTNGVTIFVSKDDDKEILDTVEYLEKNLKGYFIKTFKDKGHFTLDDMGSNEFQELLNEIIK